MEDVLEAYQRRPDDHRPLFCLDEFAKQLLSETRLPITYHEAGENPAAAAKWKQVLEKVE